MQQRAEASKPQDPARRAGQPRPPPAELELHPIEGMAHWLGPSLTALALRLLSMQELPPNEREGLLTSQEGFFRRDRYVHPRLDAATYELKITGGAEPATFSLADLEALPQTQTVCVAECAGNGNHLMGSAGLVGQAHWSGPTVQAVLQACGGPGEAAFAAFRGADGIGRLRSGYHYGLSLEELAESNTILALRHNDEPLTRARGYPVRLVAPGIYAMSYVKWLTAIELLPERHRGFYNDVLYTNRRLHHGVWEKEQARWISLKSVLTRCLRVEGGWELVGWAWGGEQPIERVLVSTDGGDNWQDARINRVRELLVDLPDDADRHAWVEFRHHWPVPTPGSFLLGSRAIAADGRAQPFAEPDDLRGHYDQVRVKWRKVDLPAWQRAT